MNTIRILFIAVFCTASMLYAIGTKPMKIRDACAMVNKEAAPDADTAIKQNKKGWEVLFDGKHTDKWKALNSDSFPSDAWKVEDGTLFVNNRAKNADIITRDVYSDFELVFDFKLTDSANSGIKYFVNYIKDNSTGSMLYNGPEYQILDDYNHPYVKDHQHPDAVTASLYLVYAPQNKKLFPSGKWNNGRVIARGKHLEHWLNGVKVVSCERGSQDFRDRIAATKFSAYDHYGESSSGHIMLTDHDGDKVYFRNIKIKRLN